MLCLADWVLIEDFGFLGGLGTDPNSMIPMALLAAAGFLALTRHRRPCAAAAARPLRPLRASRRGLQRPLGLRERAGWDLGAGRAWMAAACRAAGGAGAIRAGGHLRHDDVGRRVRRDRPGCRPDGGGPDHPGREHDPGAVHRRRLGSPINIPAPGFSLTDQYGRPVTLSGLRGKVVLLTFLDPVCVTDCPLIAQEFRQAARLLGAATSQVELVAVDVNPLYNAAALPAGVRPRGGPGRDAGLALPDQQHGRG